MGLTLEPGDLDALTEARIELARAALDRLDEIGEGETAEDALRRAREAYELRLAQLRQRAGLDDEGDPGGGEAYRRIKQTAIESERETLRRLRRDGLSGEAMLELERMIDAEEARLSR